MFYIDTSVLVSAVSAEVGTRAVLEWLETAEDVSVSDWLMTEAVAALSQKQRMGVISVAEGVGALAALRRHVEGAFQSLPVTREDFRAAAKFAERAETGLRGGDALHIALAFAANATLVTLDRKQARAAEMLGIPTLLLA
jgi:predicted nucleic acid-binding protein